MAIPNFTAWHFTHCLNEICSSMNADNNLSLVSYCCIICFERKVRRESKYWCLEQWKTQSENNNIRTKVEEVSHLTFQFLFASTAKKKKKSNIWNPNVYKENTLDNEGKVEVCVVLKQTKKSFIMAFISFSVFNQMRIHLVSVSPNKFQSPIIFGRWCEHSSFYFILVREDFFIFSTLSCTRLYYYFGAKTDWNIKISYVTEKDKEISQQ